MLNSLSMTAHNMEIGSVCRFPGVFNTAILVALTIIAVLQGSPYGSTLPEVSASQALAFIVYAKRLPFMPTGDNRSRASQSALSCLRLQKYKEIDLQETVKYLTPTHRTP